MLIESAEIYRENVTALLTAANLPVSDLPPVLNNFFAAVNEGNVIGVIGLEFYGNCALLRSLVVTPVYRNQAIARALLDKAEQLASANHIKEIYLLTETATLYFKQKGYAPILRHTVPEAIKASSEFSQVCPVTAIVMKKELN